MASIYSNLLFGGRVQDLTGALEFQSFNKVVLYRTLLSVLKFDKNCAQIKGKLRPLSKPSVGSYVTLELAYFQVWL